MTRPVRLQLSRRKGFDLQADSRAVNGLPAVVVARPGKWGNPYQAGADGDGDRAYLAGLYRSHIDRQLAPDAPGRESTIAALRDLRGSNLACWCPPGPCHADVLLELANGPICEETTGEAARPTARRASTAPSPRDAAGAQSPQLSSGESRDSARIDHV